MGGNHDRYQPEIREKRYSERSAEARSPPELPITGLVGGDRVSGRLHPDADRHPVRAARDCLPGIPRQSVDGAGSRGADAAAAGGSPISSCHQSAGNADPEWIFFFKQKTAYEI